MSCFKQSCIKCRRKYIKREFRMDVNLTNSVATLLQFSEFLLRFSCCLLLSCFIISPFSHFNSFIFLSKTIFHLLRYALYFCRLFFSIFPCKACPYFLHSPLLWRFETKPFLLSTPLLLLMVLRRPKRPSGSQPKTMRTP